MEANAMHRSMNIFFSLLFTVCYIGVLQSAVPHQIVRVFKGDTIPLKCPHDPSPIDKVVVQRGDEQGNVFEVLFKCERNKYNTAVACRNRMDEVVDQRVNWTNGIFYDSIFHISHASFYNIGRYSCNYYNYGQYLTNNSIHVDVLEPPSSIAVKVDGHSGPDTEARYESFIGYTTTVSCTTESRPAANITWDYPAELKIEQITKSSKFSEYLTNMTSTLALENRLTVYESRITCIAQYINTQYTLRREIYLQWKESPGRISVTSLNRSREEVVRDGDILTLELNEEYIIVCSTFSSSMNQIYPHWQLPKQILSSANMQSSPLNRNPKFIINNAQLTVKGDKKYDRQGIRCVTDNEEDMISLSFRVVGDSDIMLLLCTLFAVILATTTILVAIVMIIRRNQRNKNKLTVTRRKRSGKSALRLSNFRQSLLYVHGTCPESDDKVTSRYEQSAVRRYTEHKKKQHQRLSKFRRSLPSVPAMLFKHNTQPASEGEDIYQAVGRSAENDEFLLVSRDKFTIGRELSSSDYVTRWSGVINVRGRDNMKTLISCGNTHAKTELRQVWRNYVGLLLELPDNKNILQTLGICYQNENIYVTHHYEDTVTLLEYLQTDRIRRPRHHAKEMFTSLLTASYDVVSGMEFLTSHKCCHPGLCTQNILVDDQNMCKLYDFCKQEDAPSVIEQFHIEKDQHLRITLPPEALLLGEYNSASDIWAIGVVLWSIFSYGASPSTNELKDIFETQSFGNVAHDNTSVIPEELLGLIKSCWSTRVAKRPSIFSVVKTLRSGSSSILKEIRNGNINPLDLVPVHFPTTPCREAACPTNVSVTVTTHQDESPSQEHYERVLYKDTSGD
ncbi:uncharacterized protein [Apostichopus japonicus]|uniref:uncharacterized protein n=1 Tax=Stichopus japonicus TaxID=307972 RepID=UPI003AB24D11